MALNIVLSSYTLDMAGVPTYTLTLYHELTRRGHRVVVYCPKGGTMSALMPTVASPSGLTPDVIVAQHNKCAYTLRGAFPSVPMVYSAHGVLPDIEQPPRGISVDWWTAINQQVRDHMMRQYVPGDRIDIVRDFIDTSLYKPLTPLRIDKPRVLFVSNYKKWKAYYRLAVACQRLGWSFKAVGSPYGRSRNMVEEMNNADLIVSWGRGILEGMACGRPVVSYDKELGDGYLTRDVYMESRERNFSGYECRHWFDADGIMRELRKYNPADGPINRHLIENNHDHRDGTSRVLAAIDRAMARV